MVLPAFSGLFVVVNSGIFAAIALSIAVMLECKTEFIGAFYSTTSISEQVRNDAYTSTKADCKK
jgi:hypothetical protein